MSTQITERRRTKRLTLPLLVATDVVSRLVERLLVLSSTCVVSVVSVEVESVMVELTCSCLRSTQAGAAEVNVARKAKKRRMATVKGDTERDIVNGLESGEVGVGSWGRLK